MSVRGRFVWYKSAVFKCKQLDNLNTYFQLAMEYQQHKNIIHILHSDWGIKATMIMIDTEEHNIAVNVALL